MIGLTKEDGDKILEGFLIEVTKNNGTPRMAEESFKIMDSFPDSQLVLSTIMIKSMKAQGMIPEHVLDFERQIMSALATIFSDCEKEYIPIQMQGIFDGNEDQIVENVRNSKKLNFAIEQFVSAYYQYDFFENKYPEISKQL